MPGAPDRAPLAGLARLAELAEYGRVMTELTALIARDPGMAERLIREHSNQDGHCRVCSSGGQSGRYAWPCSIYRAAVAAAIRRTDGC